MCRFWGRAGNLAADGSRGPDGNRSLAQENASKFRTDTPFLKIVSIMTAQIRFLSAKKAK